jgi:hypothetical protein
MSLRVSQKPVLNDIFEFRGRAKEIIDVRFKEGMKASLRHVFERLIQRPDFLAFMVKKAAIQAGFFPTPDQMATLSTILLSPEGKDLVSGEFSQLMSGWEENVNVILDVMAEAMNSPFATEILLKDVGVLCLSEKPLNQPMWAHYADGGRGAVVGVSTRSKRFFRPPSEKPPKASSLGQVRYSDVIVEALFDDVYSMFLNKNSDWAYEKEWRALYPTGECECVGQDQNGHDVYLVQLDPEDIKEIFFGYNFKYDDVMEMATLLILAGVKARTCFVTGLSVEGLKAEFCVES